MIASLQYGGPRFTSNRGDAPRQLPPAKVACQLPESTRRISGGSTRD